MHKLLAASLAFAFASTAVAQATTVSPYSLEPGPLVYTENAAPANAFADSIGFDANYENHMTPQLVTTELEWSQIHHLRDGGPVSTDMINLFAMLGQHGIYHSIGMREGFSASTLETYMKAFMPYVDYVEPANEADNDGHPNFPRIRTDQALLYRTIRANHAWDRVAVFGPSFANPVAHAKLVGPLDSYEDFGQIHNGTCDWEPSVTGTSGIEGNIIKIRVTTVYKPLVTTETGYGDDFKRGCSLPDDNISRYIPREAALRFMYRMPRTYFTFLVDRPADVVFGSLGMLHPSGAPKPQFLTLGNLVRLTADPGPSIGGRRVSYAISGATADVAHLILARRDGSYDLLIWRELPSWDHHNRRQIGVSSEEIKVALPAGLSYATMYKTNSSYGYTSTRLSVSHGATSSFAIDDKVTTLRLSRTAASSTMQLIRF